MWPSRCRVLLMGATALRSTFRSTRILARMTGDEAEGFNCRPPQRLQRSERTFLIRPHQARITRDVGRQDRCQAPLDPILCHHRPYKV